MKIKIVKYIDYSEIELIPKIGLRISEPDFINMDYKFTYRDILFSIRFLVFAFGIKIKF